MTHANLGMGLGKRRPVMKPSERLDALRPSLEREAEEAERLRPVTLDQLERAEAAVRDGGAGPMFSEADTDTDFHFGTDIPTGVVGEVQSGDDMYGLNTPAEIRGARIFIGVLFVALAAVLLLAWFAS